MQDKEFVDMLERHRHEFYGFVRRQVSDSADTDDVFATAVLTAYEHRRSFQPGTNFRAWMFKILVNHCFVANRQDRRSAVSLDDAAIEDLAGREKRIYGDILANPHDFMMQCGDEVVQALEVLRPIERMCFLLLAVEKYTYKEIAEIIEIPVASVTTHLARGRARLKTRLSQYALEKGFEPGRSGARGVPSTKGGRHGS
jgi:RNA polymerase sigma-70 factor (ECF subfamily)